MTEARYLKAARDLRMAIWDPVVSRFGDAKLIFVVLDGALNLVNLATLPAADGRYLVESGPLLHYLSTERDIARQLPETRTGRGLLVLGGPAFSSSLSALRQPDQPSNGSGKPPVKLASASVYRGARSSCGAFRSLRFIELPASGEEATEIAALWNRAGGASDWKALSLTGTAANESQFKISAPDYRVLHLATHGFFLGDSCRSAIDGSGGGGGLNAARDRENATLVGENPLLLSGLALAGANHRDEAEPDEDDGILTAEEIAAMDLTGAEWVVLSACKTGVGRVQAGEGVLGLRRAFEVAGARTLIMSLWSVQDEASREWMRALYDGRTAGLATAEAVREASLKMIRARRLAGRSAHPFYWGAFVAAGDWR